MSNAEKTTKPEFSAAAQEELKALFARYPDRQSAMLMVLHLAQREFGYISLEVEELVAEVMERPVTEVHGVVTFYTMYNINPIGKYHVQLCRNIACWIKKAPGLLEHLKSKLGIDVGQTSSDGIFTLTEVECLAHCENAPAMQINDDIIGDLTEEKIDRLIDGLK